MYRQHSISLVTRNGRLSLSNLVAGTLIAILSFSSKAQAVDSSWAVDADGNWNDSANWSGTVIADGTDGIATFPNIITADRTVTLGADRTIGVISFEDTSHNLTISGANILTMDVSAGNAEIGVSNSSRTLNISSSIAGNDGLTKSGAGSLYLSGNNTFTGGLNIADGKVVVNSSSDPNALGDSSNVVTFTGNSTLYNTNNTFTMAQGIAVNPGITGILEGAFGEKTFVNGVVSGSGTLRIDGNSNGFQVYWQNTANTFTGAIEIYSNPEASLRVNSLADSANPIKLGTPGQTNKTGTFEYQSGAISPLVLNGRQIQITGNSGTTGIIRNNASLANTITINTDLGTAGTGSKTLRLEGNNTGDNTFAGVIGDGTGMVVSLFKDNGGKWVLSGTNTYTGDTTVNNGTLEIGGAGQLGSGNYAGNISINTGDTLIYNSTANQVFSGVISGPGSLSKNNTSTLTLDGNNTYAGATTVDNGTLLINGSTSGSSLVSIGANGTLGGSGTIGGNAIIQGSHTPGTSPGVQTFSSDLSYTGGSSNVVWELIDNTNLSPGTNYDQILVGSNLNFTGATTLDLVFNSGSSVNWNNSFWTSDHLGTDGWLLYDVAGTTFDFSNLSLATINWLDSNGASFDTALTGETTNAMFFLSQEGQDVYLNFAAATSPPPVPEPGTLGLALAALGMMSVRRNGRRRG